MSPVQPMPSNRAEQPLVVRIGGQRQWKIDKLPSTEPAANATEQAQVSRKGVMDWFRRGITVGLALGCLCLVLFHQLNPPHAPTKTVIIAPAPHPATAKGDHGVTAGPLITIPAVRLYAVVSKPQRNHSTAMDIADRARRRGQVAYLFTATGTGVGQGHDAGHGYIVVFGLASYTADLMRIARDHAADGAAIVPFRWDAVSVPSSPGSSVDTTTRVTTWLSSEVSAMSALVAGLMDKEPMIDAITAVRAADRQAPSHAQMESTGWSQTLGAVRQLTDDGLDAAKQGNGLASQNDAVYAYSLLHKMLSQK